MAIFQIYPHSYTFSKLIIFLTKSPQHINRNWPKQKFFKKKNQKKKKKNGKKKKKKKKKKRKTNKQITNKQN